MKPMLPGQPTRHFVTLCDSAFLPMALCLHASLLTHAEPFELWVLCLDEEVEGHFRQLALSHVSLIPLRDVESEALLRVKGSRTAVEYCWTLTPFAPQFVFERDPGVRQVTYLDADLCFFDSPEILLKELEASGKSVLITEHAYAPEYDQTATSGRFCVQFLTISRTDGGDRVMKWWQARCLEWCFNRLEDGKFGDQKYLDDWPERFADEVHVVRQVERTLAPWNVRHFERLGETRVPVFYHFHSLRVLSRNRVRLYSGYEVGALGSALYDRYLHALRNSVRLMDARRIDLTLSSSQPWNVLRWLKRRVSGVVEAYVRLD